MRVRDGERGRHCARDDRYRRPHADGRGPLGEDRVHRSHLGACARRQSPFARGERHARDRSRRVGDRADREGLQEHLHLPGRQHGEPRPHLEQHVHGGCGGLDPAGRTVTERHAQHRRHVDVDARHELVRFDRLDQPRAALQRELHRAAEVRCRHAQDHGHAQQYDVHRDHRVHGLRAIHGHAVEGRPRLSGRASRASLSGSAPPSSRPSLPLPSGPCACRRASPPA